MSAEDNEIINDENYIPPELLEAAEIATKNSLPEKSRQIYLKCYEEFLSWKMSKNTKSFDEKVLLAYFLELSKASNSATLWSKYSMLKAMINVENNIDIKNYAKLRSFLKSMHTHYKPKKAKVLSPANIDEFLDKAPDNTFLATKVALILGITGACRRDELSSVIMQYCVTNICNTALTMENIEIEKSVIIVRIPDTKTHIPKCFTVEGKYSKLINKYINSRPPNTKINKFFLCYRNGKCINQVIGLNKIGNMPQEIATFLTLPDAKLYTGHSFRRTSATLLADSGADITMIKRHGGWKSSNVAEGYIEESIQNKRKISNQIVNSINNDTERENSDDSVPNKKLIQVTNNDEPGPSKSTVNQNSFQFTFQFNNLNHASVSNCEAKQ